MAKSTIFIPKSVLEELYLQKKLPDSEIGKLYGVSGGIINRIRGKYNIKAIEYYERHPKQALDQKEKEFLIGTLLGDAHIRLRREPNNKNRAYPQVMFEQCVKHLEYINWLKEQMKDWISDPSKPLRQCRKTTKGKAHHSYAFQTICHPVFKEFYDGFYEKQKKIVNIDFIAKYISEFSLAAWLMDDGTRSHRIKLCSHSFSRKENELLKNLLKSKFDLHCNVINVKSDGKFCYLEFSKKSSEKVSRLVERFIVPSMKYKIISSETTKGSDNLIINPKV